jgi:hypothetical protein
MTGYQRKQKSHCYLLNLIEDSMVNSNKIEFIQTSLMGALEVYKNHIQISMKYSERDFHTIFDGRRQFTDNIPINKGVLLDTKPLKNKEECMGYRTLMTGFKNTCYHVYDNKTLLKPIKNTLSLCQRMFLRAVLESKLGLSINTLGGLQNIIDLLIQMETKDAKYTKGYLNKVDKFIYLIACLKRKGSFVSKCIPFNEMSEKFVRFIKSNIKEFDAGEFLEVTL